MRALGVLLADLADLGYDTNWTCVRASDVGAPHRRERVLLTAWPSRPGSRTAVEDPDSEPGQQRRLSAPCQTQARPPRTHPGRRDRTPAAHSDRQRRCQGLTEPVPRRWQPHPCLHRSHARGQQCLHRRCDTGRDRLLAAHPGLIRRERRSGDNPETPGRSEPPNGCHSPARWWGDYLPAIRRWEHVTERAAPKPTQPGTRRLSAEFVEWMMGLDGHVTGTPGLSRAAQLRLLGNSVVPHQAARAMGILLPDGIPCRRLAAVRYPAGRRTVSTRPESGIDVQDRGLDGIAETERPWSSVTGTRPTTRGVPAERPSRERPLKVSAQFVAIEGSDGEALQQRRIVAIRRALAWLVAHPQNDDRSATG